MSTELVQSKYKLLLVWTASSSDFNWKRTQPLISFSHTTTRGSIQNCIKRNTAFSQNCALYFVYIQLRKMRYHQS